MRDYHGINHEVTNKKSKHQCVGFEQSVFIYTLLALPVTRKLRATGVVILSGGPLSWLESVLRDGFP